MNFFVAPALAQTSPGSQQVEERCTNRLIGARTIAIAYSKLTILAHISAHIFIA